MDRAFKYGSDSLPGLRHLASFCVVSFPLTLLILLFFYSIGTGRPHSFFSIFFAISIPAYYFLVLLFVTMLLLPLYLVPYARYLVIIPKICLDFYLMVDLFIFNIYRFHIDALFFSIIIHDFHGIGVPAYVIALLILSLALIVLLNVMAFVHAPRLVMRPAMISLAVVFLCFFGQLLHAWGNEYNQGHITRYVPQFPYFYPLKASSFIGHLARKVPATVPLHSHNSQVLPMDANEEDDRVLLRYPLEKFDCHHPSGKSYNILMFIFESWRSDMMNSSVTPAISAFAQKSYLFTNHLSGGNVTHAGLFSLMYGLQPSYLRYMSTDPTRYEPVLMRVLKDNGYAINVYTSSNLNGFSLKKMFFQDIAKASYIMKGGEKDQENDRLLVSRLIKSIKNKKTAQPFFTFVFLTSSHHGYSYPESHEVFRPTAKDGSFLFNKYADPVPLMNRYKNSLHYLDSLFGEVLAALKETRLDENTIIVLSSDHGEEFNDKGYGYWGHGSNFTRSQVSVPLILFLPDEAEGHVITKRSSHIDLVPTLLKHYFGCGSLYEYSNGSDLLDLPDHRCLIIKSYKNKAYVIDDIVYAEGIPIDSYYLNDWNKKNTLFNSREIALLKKSEGCFVR